MKEKISEFVYSHREEMVDIIRQLVEIPSVKGKPEQIGRAACRERV